MVNYQSKLKNYIIFCILFSVVFYFLNWLDTITTTILWTSKCPLMNFVIHIFLYPIIILFAMISLLKISNIAQNYTEINHKNLFFVIILYLLISVIYGNTKILNFYFSFLPSYLTFIILTLFLYKIKEIKNETHRFLTYSFIYLMSNLVILYYINNLISIIEKYNINLILFLIILIKNIGIYYLIKFIKIYDAIHLKGNIPFIINTIVDMVLLICFVEQGIKNTFLIMAAGYIFIWGLYKIVLLKGIKKNNGKI